MVKTKYILERKKDKKLLLMHLLTFDIIILDNYNGNKWLENKFIDMSNTLVNLLVRKMFLIDSVESDKQLLQCAQDKFSKRKLRVPNIVIYLTNQCNLRCSYCYTGYEVNKKSEYIKKEYIDKIFNSIKTIYSINDYLNIEPIISLFGGEPLLPINKNNIEYILKNMEKYNFNNIEIVTNLINIKYFSNIFKMFNQKYFFKVTLNGDKKLHDKLRRFPNGEGTYDLTFLNIQFILENINNSVIDLSILLENSIDEFKIKNLFDDLKKYGFLHNSRIKIRFGLIQFRTNYICPGFCDKLINPADYYPLLYKFKKNNLDILDNMIGGSSMYLLNQIYRSYFQKDKIVVPNFLGCDAVYPGRFCFYTDGNIYPCYDCVGMKGFEIGKYNEDELYFNDNYFLWRNFDVTKLDKCNECKFVGFCNGGCLTSNISKSNSIFLPYCDNIEESIINFLDYCYKENIIDGIYN